MDKCCSPALDLAPRAVFCTADEMGLASCAIPAAGANVPSHSCPLQPSVATPTRCPAHFTSLLLYHDIADLARRVLHIPSLSLPRTPRAIANAIGRESRNSHGSELNRYQATVSKLAFFAVSLRLSPLRTHSTSTIVVNHPNTFFALLPCSGSRPKCQPNHDSQGSMPLPRQSKMRACAPHPVESSQ